MKGYHIAAAKQLKGVDQCWCGTSYNTNGRPSEDCNNKCNSDKKEWCGGNVEFLIAHTAFVGYYKEVTNSPDIGTRMNVISVTGYKLISVEQCRRACKQNNYTYAGLRSDNSIQDAHRNVITADYQCYCSNSYGAYGKGNPIKRNEPLFCHNALEYCCDPTFNGRSVNVVYISVNPCAVDRPNYCYNGGSCSFHLQPNATLNTSVTCQCPPSTTGARCERFLLPQVLPCSSNPCLNDATCTDDLASGSYVCTCRSHFTGQHCESESLCHPNPCEQNAPCTEHFGFKSFKCTCPPGYRGKFCDAALPCTLKPCRHGGTCLPSSDEMSFTCACTSQFIGDRCQFVNPCSSCPCRNGGSCSLRFLDRRPVSFTCSCTANFTGPRCETYSVCSRAPCMNGGTCVDLPSRKWFKCLCPPEYIGAVCQQRRQCLRSPCYNDGTCVDDEMTLGYHCNCRKHTSGRRCEHVEVMYRKISMCRKDRKVCGPNAYCFGDVNSYWCECWQGYEKIDPQDPHSHCQPLPKPTDSGSLGTCKRRP